MYSHGKTTIGHISHFNDLFKQGIDLYQMAESRFPGSDPFCVGCSIEGLCAGQCHVTREVANNETGVNPLFLDFCDFYRQVTNALIIEELKSAVP